MVHRTQITVTLILLLLGLAPAGPGEANVRGPSIVPDESGNVIEVKTNTGTPDKVYFYLNDHLSTPRIVTNDMGQGVWRARYAPFGQRIDQCFDPLEETWDAPCPLAQPIRFPGQWDDGIPGVWYNWHRFYLPEYGIYGRVDPVFQVGAQVWDYVGGNPVSGIDPEGLKEPTVNGFTATAYALGPQRHADMGRMIADGAAGYFGTTPIEVLETIAVDVAIVLGVGAAIKGAKWARKFIPALWDDAMWATKAGYQQFDEVCEAAAVLYKNWWHQPHKAPGPGWVQPVKGQNWWNKEYQLSLRPHFGPNFEPTPGHAPHWDLMSRTLDRAWRVFEDMSVELKP